LHKPLILAYHMGECIDHFEREKRELWLLCTQSGVQWNFVFPFTEYHIDKVPMYVDAFLVSEPRKISMFCVWLCYIYA
jgi:hypothetical protein